VLVGCSVAVGSGVGEGVARGPQAANVKRIAAATSQGRILFSFTRCS